MIVPLLRAMLGLRRRITVEGVRYKEKDTAPIDRALSSKKRGEKQYEVRFPAGRSMTIHCTPQRRYADLMDVPELRSIAFGENLVRPGSRVLVLGVGTGAPARLIAEWIGPHGGLVAIDRDNESIRFARRRYRIEGVSFERGGPELLAGELDGAFDLVMITQHWIERCDEPGHALNEAWRVTTPGGRMILVGDPLARFVEGSGIRGTRVSRLAPPDGGPALIVIDKPGKGRDRDRVDARR